METGAFREILAADVAVSMGVLDATAAGAALAAYWESRTGSVLARLGDDDRARVEAEVARILEEAGGDAQAAVRNRGVDRELPASLAPEASHALSEAGARLRAPLRAMDRKRYVGFMPLGQGGMGVVYLALDSELNRRVAFKMIRAGVTDPLAEESGPISDDMVARFMQEAVVTGGLEHPGIVPVYELGITPSGAPYYTMRLVRGERTLDDAIKRADTIEARLALLEPLLKVCDAVGYAHSRGVIHRDLKPANIALGQFGEVVVLDWGLAKMHERPDLAASRWQSRLAELRDVTDLHTLTSALGTPGYMAPEAALGEVGKIDRRTDIYSLGAILYRILTGAFPFEFSTFPEYVAMQSRGLGELPDPPGLGRICRQALAPRREDRFQDVGELAAAIRTWQNESAIDREVDGLRTEAQAALEGAGGAEGEEQLRQLDHTIAVAARILDLRPEHEDATALRDRARGLRSAAMAKRVAHARRRFAKRVGIAALLVATAATIVVAVLLNARRQEAEGARARAEDLAGFMLNDLHDGLVPVGRLNLLKKVARKSLDYYASLPTADVTDDVRRARARILARIGEVLLDSSDLDGALDACRRSKSLWEALGDRYEVSVVLNQIGDVLRERGDLDGALGNYERSAKIRRALGRKGDLARSLDRAGDVLMRKGARGQAAKLYAESLAIRRALVQTEPGNAEHRGALAASLLNQGELALGDLPVARRHFEEARAIYRALLEDQPGDATLRDHLAGCVFRVAHCQAQMGEAAASAKTYGEALAFYRQLAEGDPTNAWYQRNLGLTLEALGRDEEALEVRRGLAARDPTNARLQSDLCAVLRRVGDAATARKEFAGAERYYKEALTIARRLMAANEDNPDAQEDLADALSQMGALYAATKRATEARASYEEALKVRQGLAQRDPENTAWKRAVALSLDHLGRYEESLAIRRELYEQDPTNVTWQADLAWGLGRMGTKTRDPKYYEEALPIRRAFAKNGNGDEGPQRELAVCLYMIGTLYEGKGDLEKALPPLREAEQIHRAAKSYRNEYHFWADAYFRVSYNAACEAAQKGDKKKALAHLKENLEWSKEHLPKDQWKQHREHARTGDPDLQPLRGIPEFGRLFG